MTGSLASSIERARQGDVAAFDEIVLALHAPLLRFAGAVLGGDLHTAHDVVQEAFVALWSALPSLAEPRYVRAWLYRVAYRRAVTWLRRRGPGGRAFAVLCPDGEEPVGPEVAAPARTWNVGGAWLPSEEATPRLKAALVSLPALYAAPLTLYYLESLEMDETAELLGLSVPTLKMRLHRGRELLRARVLTKEPWRPIRTRRQKPHPRAAVLVAETGTSPVPADGEHRRAVDAPAPASKAPASSGPFTDPGTDPGAGPVTGPGADPGALAPSVIERALP